MKKVFITILCIVILCGGYYIYTNSKKPGKYDELAQCIEKSGTKFYGAFWCPHCQAQKALFGKSAKKLPYVECALYKSEETKLKDQVLTAYKAGTYTGPFKQELDDMKQKGFLEKWYPSRNEICAEKKIEGYPTWILADGTVIPVENTAGVTLKTLAEKTSCRLPE